MSIFLLPTRMNLLFILREGIRQGEDIWVSYAHGNKWSTAIKIDEPELENETRYISINTFDNDGAHTITAGGRQLLFTSCQRPGGLGSCDLYSL
jgi:hypothetical protein